MDNAAAHENPDHDNVEPEDLDAGDAGRGLTNQTVLSQSELPPSELPSSQPSVIDLTGTDLTGEGTASSSAAASGGESVEALKSRRVTVVTGANSGIGRACALYLATHGHRVIGTVRDASRAGSLMALAEQAGVQIELVTLDIADDQSVVQGFATIAAMTGGRIDALVNNAGVGGNGVVEETSSARFLEVMNIDLCGAVRCIQQVLPSMRERRSGTIVNITSVAGRIAAIAQAPYVAAKWALEGISEQLAIEVIPFGVRVAIVEPGVTKSSIFGKNTDVANESGAYEAQYERMLQMYAAGYHSASDAVEVAKVVLEAIETEHAKLRYPVSWGASELIYGRQRITDEQWVELGQAESLADYIDEFKQLFDLDISTPPKLVPST